MLGSLAGKEVGSNSIQLVQRCRRSLEEEGCYRLLRWSELRSCQRMCQSESRKAQPRWLLEPHLNHEGRRQAEVLEQHLAHLR